MMKLYYNKNIDMLSSCLDKKTNTCYIYKGIFKSNRILFVFCFPTRITLCAKNRTVSALWKW
ncbi:MAG: hypothetical protein A2339_05745 [Elusimicrobia bacterium RIFOXYB12_FULL_50_12]|nr:MAG: hypothetical protein A2278_08745 [Elusimicrobia bacterium RIFOXYA12_FULL_49_49]OGS14785.1 MAG: hypothetical protein A2251_09850 [Elusimicrobia bacterium RIFOXYA2_FULL_47_53]OGS25565.1 MAG: hypothetical protein A2339_05745 [Elusimicrobia bacterium RIFOXYB12_FULL_50_12]OGS28931.1 MAG: hypothetical protein A2323_05175 [Elusimicrobia bacterium RIFOXYB2_FULL_46_23]